MSNFKIIKSIEHIDKKKWEEFVLTHPNGNIFQTPEMYHVYLNTKNYKPILLAVINDNNEILAVLLAVLQKEYKGFLGNFTTRSIIIGGPVVKDNNVNVLDYILKEYNSVIKGKSIYSQFRNFCDWKELYKIFKRNHCVYEQHLNILIDLTIGIEKLWNGVKSNRKDGINKGKRQNLIFEVSDNSIYLKIFYNLLKTTYKKAKVPFPDISFFVNIINEMSNHMKWFILKKDNIPIIILLSLTFNNTIFAYYIGISDDNKYLVLRPVDYFYWKVLEWGIENHYTTFDWMGAGKPDKEYGVRKFKLQYGGELVNYGRFLSIHNKLLYNVGKLGLKLYALLK